MKNKKFKLHELKVQSFVTSLDNASKETIKGQGGSDNPACVSAVAACQNSQANICQTCGDARSTCPIIITLEPGCSQQGICL